MNKCCCCKKILEQNSTYLTHKQHTPISWIDLNLLFCSAECILKYYGIEMISFVVENETE